MCFLLAVITWAAALIASSSPWSAPPPPSASLPFCTRAAELSVLCQSCKLQPNEGKYNEGTDESKPYVQAALPCLMCQTHTHTHTSYQWLMTCTRMLCSKIHNRKPLLRKPECVRVNSMLCSFSCYSCGCKAMMQWFIRFLKMSLSLSKARIFQLLPSKGNFFFSSFQGAFELLFEKLQLFSKA